MVTLPKEGAKSCPWAENLNKLLTVKGVKFKLSAQERDLAPFFGIVKKVKIPSEIKLPLVLTTIDFQIISQEGGRFWI